MSQRTQPAASPLWLRHYVRPVLCTIQPDQILPPATPKAQSNLHMLKPPKIPKLPMPLRYHRSDITEVQNKPLSPPKLPMPQPNRRWSMTGLTHTIHKPPAAPKLPMPLEHHRHSTSDVIDIIKKANEDIEISIDYAYLDSDPISPPLFERGRFYEVYAARREEWLRKMHRQVVVETVTHKPSVAVELAKGTNVKKVTEGVRKSVLTNFKMKKPSGIPSKPLIDVVKKGNTDLKTNIEYSYLDSDPISPPLFERGRFYEVYAARRDEWLWKKHRHIVGETMTHEPSVAVELAKGTNVKKVIEVVRKSVPTNFKMKKPSGIPSKAPVDVLKRVNAR